MSNRRKMFPALFMMFLFTFMNYSNLAASSGFPAGSSDEENPCDTILIEPDTLEFCIYDNALPFIYEDSNLTASGFYTFHHVSVLGCDSDIVIQLTVFNTVSTSRPQIQRVTLCSYELPYIVENYELTTSGIYTIITQSTNGCDSAYLLALTVLEVPDIEISGDTYLCPGSTATLSVDSCEGCSYQWSNGSTTTSITVSEAGMYYLSVLDENLCLTTDSAVIIAAEAPDAHIIGDSTICYGDSTTLSVTEGHTYVWENSGTSEPLTVVLEQDSTFYAIITDTLTLCSKRDSLTITTLPLPTVSILASALEFCEGDSTLLTASGGTSYLWSTGDTTASIYVKTSNQYQVTAFNEYGCHDTASVNITVHPSPTITILGNTSFCSGETATITLTGATSYQWSNGNNTATLTTSSPGNYSVTCTDIHNCSTTLVIPLSYSIVRATLTGNTSYCQGSSTVLKVIGDSTNTYQWINGTQSDSMVVSSIGTVSVIVTNTTGCQALLTANITELPNPTPSITCTQGALTICQGSSASLRASGGLRYAWSSGSTTNSIIVREEGTYTVTVTAANGCTAEASESIIVNPTPTVIIVSPDEICSGEVATLHAIAPTAQSFSWSSGHNTPSITVYPNQGLSYYMVSVVDENNCSNTASTTINTIERPNVFINGLNNSTITICQNNIQALTATTGASYQWSNGLTDNTIYVSSDGTYSVTVYNADGCSSSASVTVNTKPLPVASITESTTICQGQTATLIATFNNSYTYLWSNSSNTNSITTGVPGTYTVTVTNADNCTLVMSSTLTVNEKPQVSISGSTSICAGETTQLTASADMPSSYIWSTGDTNSITTVGGSSNTYRVTAYNAYGCSNSASVTVIVHSLPVPFITGSTTICRGQSTTLTATGGVSYMWSNGHTSAQISVSPSTNITYTVTATDQFGCRANVSATVTVNVIPSISILGNRSFCEGSSTTLTATGGSYYTWSTGDNSSSISVGTVGNYSVTATNSLGCQNSESVMITSMNLPSISIAGRSNICPGSTDTLTAGGATQYVWSTGETGSTIHVMPTASTTYTVTGYGYNGCMSTASKVVNIENRPDVQINGVTILCEGESTTLTAVGGNSYLWANGSTDNHITVSQNGNYAVVATNAAGCSNTASISVTVNPIPRIGLTGPSSFCENSTATIMANGGSSYRWSNGSSQSTLILTTGGSYAVTAYNSFGCQSDTTFTVTTLPVPTAIITGTTNLCEGETGYLTASESFQYSWSNGSTNQTISVTPLETTNYYVTVTSENGCSNFTHATLYVHPTYDNHYTAEICQDNSFSQYGFNIPVQHEPGTYVFTDSLQSIYGCDSICTLTLTVNPKPVINGGIIGNDIVTNYGNYYYHISDVENASIFEWSITNPRWTLSSSTINSVFLNIQNAGNGTLIVKAINACGYQDTNLVISCVVGVEDYTPESRISIYPNPVSRLLHINTEDSGLQFRDVELIDAAGRCVLRTSAKEAQMQIDCTPFANGMYMLRLTDEYGQQVENRKIIINK